MAVAELGKGNARLPIQTRLGARGAALVGGAGVRVSREVVVGTPAGPSPRERKAQLSTASIVIRALVGSFRTHTKITVVAAAATVMY